VQLASYRSEAEATAGWQTLTAEQKDLLAKLPHAVAKADLGADKGIYYRLQAGTFSDRQAAKALCMDLQDRSVDCMVVEATTETPSPAKTQQSMATPDRSFLIGER
jgi:cell division septation protein DedD